jgi:hypothetical protein
MLVLPTILEAAILSDATISDEEHAASQVLTTVTHAALAGRVMSRMLLINVTHDSRMPRS